MSDNFSDTASTMKHQQVSVDFWKMLKTTLSYGVLTVMMWMMVRLFTTVFLLPRRMRSQQEQMQETLADLKRRFPDLDFTEDDIMNAEKNLEELLKEEEENDKKRALELEQTQGENREKETENGVVVDASSEEVAKEKSSDEKKTD